MSEPLALISRWSSTGQLILLGIIIMAASGVPGLLLSRWSNTGQWLTTLLAVLGAAIGLAGVGLFWVSGDSQRFVFPWAIAGV